MQIILKRASSQARGRPLLNSPFRTVRTPPLQNYLIPKPSCIPFPAYLIVTPDLSVKSLVATFMAASSWKSSLAA